MYENRVKRVFISYHIIYFPSVDPYRISVHTVKKNVEALVAATKEIGVEVNAHKTKYMTVSRDQNAGRIHSMKMDKFPLKRWKSSNIWEQL